MVRVQEMPQSRKALGILDRGSVVTAARPGEVLGGPHLSTARCPWQSYDEKAFQSEHKPSVLIMAGHDAGVQCNCCLNMQSRSMLPLGDIISSRALLGSNYG